MADPCLWSGTDVGKVSLTPFANPENDVIARVTSISMSGLERDVEEVFSMGNNSCLKKNPQGLAEVEIGLKCVKPDVAQAVLGGSGTVVDGISYPGAADRLRHRIILLFETSSATDVGQKQRFVWEDGWGVNLGKDVDSEGYLEETVSFKCLAQDYDEQYTADASITPLSTLATYT